MGIKCFRIWTVWGVLVSLVSLARGETVAITVEIFVITPPNGQIVVGLYRNSDRFPEPGKTFRSQTSPVTGEKMTVVFKNIPKDTYAIALYHDHNSNGQFDKNLLGIPLEAYGFSNNVSVTVTPPAFKDAAFAFDGNRTIRIKLKR